MYINDERRGDGMTSAKWNVFALDTVELFVFP